MKPLTSCMPCRCFPAELNPRVHRRPRGGFGRAGDPGHCTRPRSRMSANTVQPFAVDDLLAQARRSIIIPPRAREFNRRSVRGREMAVRGAPVPESANAGGRSLLWDRGCEECYRIQVEEMHHKRYTPIPLVKTTRHQPSSGGDRWPAAMPGSGSDRRFATTNWRLIAAARGEGLAESREALADLCAVYWYPLYAYLRRRGLPHLDSAEDLTQGVFASLLGYDFLAGIAPEKGRVRGFLLRGRSRNYLAQPEGASATVPPGEAAARPRAPSTCPTRRAVIPTSPSTS